MPPPTRIQVQTLARAGAVQLLEDYRLAKDLRLQVFPTWPRSILPPTAYVQAINESLTEYTTTTRQRVPSVEVIVLHGVFSSADTRFNSGDAIEQRDEFVDTFLDWVADRFHAFGDNTLVSVTNVTDLPGFVPDWLPESERKGYIATQITLEGFAST